MTTSADRGGARDSGRVRAVIPEGTGPPADVPAAIFEAALRTFQDRRRLDMRALAAELGMGRSSLYRRVQSRDRLLGAVLWYLARGAIARALEAGADLSGEERVVAVVDRFLHDVQAQGSLRRLLREEPEAALRILTSQRGEFQGRLVAAVERLLAEEEAHASLALTLDRATLAYLIVRIGESFLFADVIAGSRPDVDRAVEIIAQLLVGPGGLSSPPRR